MSAPLRRHADEIRSPYVSSYQRGTLARESRRFLAALALLVTVAFLAAMVIV